VVGCIITTITDKIRQWWRMQLEVVRKKKYGTAATGIIHSLKDLGTKFSPYCAVGARRLRFVSDFCILHLESRKRLRKAVDSCCRPTKFLYSHFNIMFDSMCPPWHCLLTDGKTLLRRQFYCICLTSFNGSSSAWRPFWCYSFPIKSIDDSQSGEWSLARRLYVIG
jgi:hypothetical protein